MGPQITSDNSAANYAGFARRAQNYGTGYSWVWWGSPTPPTANFDSDYLTSGYIDAATRIDLYITHYNTGPRDDVIFISRHNSVSAAPTKAFSGGLPTGPMMIVGTWDGANASLYVNGVQGASVAQTNPGPTSAGPNALGNSLAASSMAFYEYTRGLSPEEIRQLYAQPFGVFRWPRPRLELWRALLAEPAGENYEETVSATAAAAAAATDTVHLAGLASAAAAATAAALDHVSLRSAATASATATASAAAVLAGGEAVCALAAAQAGATDAAAWHETVAATATGTASARDRLNAEVLVEVVSAVATASVAAADTLELRDWVDAGAAAGAAETEAAAFLEDGPAAAVATCSAAEIYTATGIGGVTETGWVNYQHVTVGRVSQMTWRPRNRFAYDRRSR
jgi:hypothetical protein